MSSRHAHRLSLIADGDVLHSGAIAVAACVLSAGLVYVGYFVHVLRIARRAPYRPEHGDCVLLFGKHAPAGRIDGDFGARLDRAMSLWQERPPGDVVLLGGGAEGEPSEAEVARHGLLARGFGAEVRLQLEARSRDTLQNLRNARELLRAVPVRLECAPSATAWPAAPMSTGTPSAALLTGPASKPVPCGLLPRVTLLSNRYHLARCALFARQLGFDWELCAAEPRLRLRPRTLLRLAGEAAYVCWSDLGTRWARLIGHRRMLARVT